MSSTKDEGRMLLSSFVFRQESQIEYVICCAKHATLSHQPGPPLDSRVESASADALINVVATELIDQTKRARSDHRIVQPVPAGEAAHDKVIGVGGQSIVVD